MYEIFLFALIIPFPCLDLIVFFILILGLFFFFALYMYYIYRVLFGSIIAFVIAIVKN